MRKSFSLLAALAAIATPAQAALHVRGGGTMVYDDVLDVTWAADAGPVFGSIQAARAYAAGLTLGGATDWRLPNVFDVGTSNTCAGYNCASSEVGYMHYVNFGAAANQFTFGGSNAANIALFTNHLGANLFGLNQNFTAANAGNHAAGGCDITVGAETCTWVFRNDGLQSYGGLVQPFKAWAVRDGDIDKLGAGAVPEPATWAMMILGMLAVGGAMRSRRHLAPAIAAHTP